MTDETLTTEDALAAQAALKATAFTVAGDDEAAAEALCAVEDDLALAALLSMVRFIIFEHLDEAQRDKLASWARSVAVRM